MFLYTFSTANDSETKNNHFSTIWASQEANSTLEEEAKALITHVKNHIHVNVNRYAKWTWQSWRGHTYCVCQGKMAEIVFLDIPFLVVFALYGHSNSL